MKRDGLTRRDLWRAAAVTVWTTACRGGSPSQRSPGTTAPAKSRVVVARDQQLRDSRGAPVPDKVLALLDRAMQTLYNRDKPEEAWRLVVRPNQVVGLKVNCLAGKGASTSVVLVDAVCERLQQAGVPARNIVVWDRLSADLESAGFPVRPRGSGIRYMGNEVLGYTADLYTYGKAGSLICRTLVELCDVVINLPVLKDHSITGVTIALKNLFGAIHNPNKYHLNVGDPYVADVYALEPIRSKVRLTICDAITPVYNGGPSYMPQWMWPYNGLIVSEDPVALDYTGWQVIEQKRAEAQMKSLKELKREPVYILTAADPDHRLGQSDPKHIEIIRV